LAGSFAVSAILTAIVRRLAVRVGFVSRPRQDRFSLNIVPLGGGIAIFSTLALAILSAALVVKFFISLPLIERLSGSVNIVPADVAAKIDQLIIVLLCMAALFILGLWDDKKHLGPFFKLLVQFIVAIIAAAFADVRVELFIQSKILTMFLSAFWIVLIVNVFNFLDNMDGACAGIAVIASAILFTAAATSGQVFVGGLALILIGTLLGFLLFNFPPARIFAGDAGSLVIGFFIALVTLRTTYYHEAQSGRWFAVFMPLIVMAVPLYDFVSVLFLRLRSGKSPFVGDTQHFSHRLKRRGLTDAQTVLVLYLATLCTGLSAIFLSQVDSTGAVLIFLQTLMILSIVAVLESTSA